MIQNYISNISSWLKETLPAVINEKNFLWIIGSLFLLGIVTKWVVVANYGRLIRKAENMTHPKNKTLRQIKMKFDGIKNVNGAVANPMLLVKRHLNRCKVGIISLNKMNNIINWCVIAIIGVTGIHGWQLFVNGKKDMAAAYVFIGWFLGFSLEIISRSTRVNEMKTELSYVIVDYLENSPVSSEDRKMSLQEQQETSVKEIQGDSTDNVEYEADIKQKVIEEEQLQERKREEFVLNQVIGEFLQ